MTWVDAADDTQDWNDIGCWVLKTGYWDDGCTWFDSRFWVDEGWTDSGDDTQIWSDA